MVQLLKNIIFLLAHTPAVYKWLAAPIFLVLGFVMGYLIWKISAAEDDRLIKQQSRLRDEIANLKEKLERRRKQREDEKSKKPEPVPAPTGDDLTRLSGITPEIAQRLNESGIRTYQQLAELEVLSEQERQQFATTFGLPDINLDRWRWAWTGRPTETPERKIEELETREDLTVVRGITPDLADRLHRRGIHKLADIAAWTAEDVQQFSTRLAVGRQIVEERWVEQCRRILKMDEPGEVPSLDPSVLERQFTGEPVRLDTRLGVVYTRRPELVDELQRIRGIGPMLEQELHRLGVFRFKQIAQWTLDHLKEFGARLNCFPDRMERDQWVEQARALHAEQYSHDTAWDVAEPPLVAYQQVIDEVLPGESVVVTPPYGIVYSAVPESADDLIRIEGLTPGSAAELGRLGIFRYEQIAHWSESNVAAVATWLGTSPDRIYRENWIPQARRLSAGRLPAPQPTVAFSGLTVLPDPVNSEPNPVSQLPAAEVPAEPISAVPVETTPLREGAELDSVMGYIYRSGRPSVIDDLKLIRGVGPVEETRMQQAGVYRFWQIAEWSPANVAEVSLRCSLADRVQREKWIAQAGKLAILSDASQKDSYQARTDVDQFAVVDREFAGDSVRVDPAFGILYGEAPVVLDGLTLIQGVDSVLESALHRIGIFRFKQIGAWRDANVAAVAQRLGIEKSRIESQKWVPQAVNLQRVIYAASPVWAEDRPSLDAYEARAGEVFAGEAVHLSEDLGILYAKRPEMVDALSTIHGIDAAIESRLNASGVYRFRQIANWSDRNVQAFAEWFGCHPDRIYRDRWIAQALELDQTSVISKAPPEPVSGDAEIDPFVILQEHFAKEKNVRVDRRAGIVYGERPEFVDELTFIGGVTPEIAAGLQDVGIFRFKQIAHWTRGNAREVALVLGIDPGRIESEQWIEQARRLEKQYYGASPVWSTARPSLTDYERRMSEAYADDGVGADEELGILFAGTPDTYDDLKRINGISADLEARLNASGVYRFKQIGDWSETNVEAFGAWLGIPFSRIYQQRWIAQATQLSANPPLRRAAQDPVVVFPSLAEAQFEALAQEFGDEPGARIDRQFGIVYDDPPSLQDDLKRLPGVTTGMEAVFHEHGVFRLKQIAAWTPSNESEFARVLGMPPDQFRAARWPEQARQLHEQTYRASGAWTVRRPTLEDYSRRIAEIFAGEAVRADENLGILYVRRPAVRDDLTQIQGIDAASLARLNASGVYRFKQIGNWADANVEAFARWIGVPAERMFREDWVGQAALLSKQTSAPKAEAETEPLARYFHEAGVHWRDDFGYVYGEAPAVVDDLTRIHGIDEALCATLQRHGVYRFWQIAMWSTDVVDVISGDLDLGNRIKRERWRSQARVLATLGAADEEGRFIAPSEVDHFAEIEREFADDLDVRADPQFGIVYDQRPGVVDDLCKVNGITFALEEELHRLGVYRFKQIGSWTDGNVTAVAESVHLSKDEIETGKWIPQARWHHLRTYGQATCWAEAKPSVDRFEEMLSELFPGESVRVDDKFGFVYTGRPRHKDDLCRIRGLNEALVRRLQASGMHSFRQLAWWSDANVRAIAKKLGFHPDQVYRGQWIAQAAKLDEERPETEPEMAPVADDSEEESGLEQGLVLHPEMGPIFTDRPAIIDDLKAIHGVGPKLERMLNSLGVYRFSQIANWDEAQLGAISARMRFRERIQREGWVEQARELAALRYAEHQESFFAPPQLDQIAVVDRELHGERGARVDPYLGIVFDHPPLVADDLTAIDGIGKRMERELHEAGIFRYLQIANWTDGNVAQIAENLSCLKDRIERDKWIPQARRLQRETYSASRAWGVDRPSLADYQARIEEEFSGEALRPDVELGIVYTGWPSHVDDLKEIPGIDAETERALNQLGVFCVKQLANWSVANVEAFAKRLATSPQRIYRDRWIFQAGGLPCKEPLPIQPVFEGLDVDLRRVLSVQPGLAADERLGFVYRDRPVDMDALHLIKGLGHSLEKQVNALGVYRFRQIASWSDPQVEEFASRLRIGSRVRTANWVGQAREWAALSEEERGLSFVAPSVVDQDAALEFDFVKDGHVHIDAQLGIVYEQAPVVVDDLNLINGIGAQMERELNELGVYRFKQIARWSDANVAEFARRLFCQKERIERDKLIPQAKKLLRVIYSACPEWAGMRPTADELQNAIREDFSGQRVRADQDYGIIYSERPSRPDDLKEIAGLSERLEEELNASGVWRFAQIARWAPAHVEAFALRLQIHPDRIYRERWISKARQLAASTPAVASPSPEVGRRVATPVRVAVPPVEETVTPAVPAAPSVVRPRDKAPVIPAVPAVQSPVDPAMVSDPDLGFLYDVRPSTVDELQLVDGIGPALERRLHSFGVYRYRQIADWTDLQIQNYADRLDLGSRIEREEWVKQAAELADLVESEESGAKAVAPASMDDSQSLRQLFAGEDVEVDESYGIVYVSRPDHTDNLKLVKGIGATFADRLNTVGVYRFKQIASWSEANVEAFARLLGTYTERIDREEWIRQARDMASVKRKVEAAQVDRSARHDDRQEEILRRDLRGEDALINPELGIIFRSPPREVDDLKKIRGIGKKLENSLNDHGVYQFRQIALWTRANGEEFSRRLEHFADRMFRDQWVEQARVLHGEKYGVDI